MKRYINLLTAGTFVLTGLLISFQSSAQFNTVSVIKGQPDPKADGIFYALSRNVLRVDVTIEKSARYKGPYADYARKYLGLNSVVTVTGSSYEIEQVNMTLLAERDPDQLYFIEFPSKTKSLPPLTLQLDEQGLLNGMQFSASGPVDISKSGMQRSADFIEQLQPSMTEKTDTIIRRISVDTTTIEERFVRRSVSEKSTEQQAKEAAELIRKIEENKFNLLTGYQEINYSRDALNFMLNRLDSLKNEYLDLFKGKLVKTYEYHTFYVVPSSLPEGTFETICRFSPETGLHNKSSYKGEPLSVKIVAEGDPAFLNQFLDKRANTGRKQAGIYYRIPQQSRITLTQGAREIAGLHAPISQMGRVTFLPANGLTGIKFHPLSGALIMISVN
ncbi:MAG: DUF4831 family protein [Lentimicrobiaceae bacterium]|jgi:hypothetical protein|nr:DUF4831 family protein [Lentimicrobiaceae bacterium]MDD4598563.1 DUF4831 family protein [Lentimicrobiaceae bacterium]MDY0026016.1 DUF4831 family protein [Lentimicrobium sp.]